MRAIGGFRRGQLSLVPGPAPVVRVGELLSRAHAERLQAERIGREPPAAAVRGWNEALSILRSLVDEPAAPAKTRRAA